MFSKNWRIRLSALSQRLSESGTILFRLQPSFRRTRYSWSLSSQSDPDEEIEAKLHLQSPWLLRLELDRAKMIDRKLTMAYVAGRIAESFKTNLFVIWSEDEYLLVSA
jgi:hypothetical protein